MDISVEIKAVDFEFFDFFYEIKCEKSNIYWTGHSTKPDREKLKSWFVEQLDSKKRLIFKIINNNKSVGYLYIDNLMDRVEISYAVKEAWMGKGVGTLAVKEAVGFILNSDFSRYKIVAYAAKPNVASRKILENNGFKATGLYISQQFGVKEEKIDMLEYEYKYVNCLIIAEAGVNHNGSVETAKKLIDAACAAGVDAVKFQTWKTELLVSDEARQAEYQLENTGVEETQYDMLKKLELSYDDFIGLKKYCDSKKILFMSTPDEIVSADFLNQLQDIFKIGSGELTNVPFLRHIGGFNKKIILSTGMGTLGEIEQAISVLTQAGTNKSNITLLHATTMYPTPMKDVNLSAMNIIKTAFDIDVGYSDHTMGVEVPVAAVALGAKVIEKHFTLSRDMQGPDHKASLEPDELANMVKSIRNIEMALGDGIKSPQSCELDNKKVVRKSIVAKKNIKKGDVFTVENIETKRLGSGVSSSLWDDVIGLESNYDILMNEAIRL